MHLDAVPQTAVCQTLMNGCALVRQSDLGGGGGGGRFVTHTNMEVVQKFKVWLIWDFIAEKSDDVSEIQIAD